MAKTANLTLVDEPAFKHALINVGGRGKTGKSVVIRVIGELALERGSLPVLGDLDRSNASLFAYPHLHPLVQRPASADDTSITDWLSSQVNQQIDGDGHTLIIDAGGGDQVVKYWTRDLELAPFLQANGIRPVMVHMVGGDRDDLAYIRDMETVCKYQPADTVIILNEGALTNGRTPVAGFDHITEHEVFKAAVDRGAKVLRLPRLGCMIEVDNLRVSFREAISGAVVDGRARLGPIQRQMCQIWLREVTPILAPILAWI